MWVVDACLGALSAAGHDGRDTIHAKIVHKVGAMSVDGPLVVVVGRKVSPRRNAAEVVRGLVPAGILRRRPQLLVTLEVVADWVVDAILAECQMMFVSRWVVRLEDAENVVDDEATTWWTR